MVGLGSWASAVKGNIGKQGSGRSSSKSRDFIEDFKTEVDTNRRIVIPIFEDDKGKKGVFIESRVVHPIKKARTVEIPTKSGRGFAPFAIGTSHPYKQPSFEKQLEIAERGEVDLFTEFASLIQTDKWAKADELGNDRNTEEGKAEFIQFMKDFDNQNTYIETASYKSGDEWRDHTEAYLLVLELDTVMTEEKRRSGVTREVPKVQLDDNGQPKYKPKFWKVSQKRLQAINSAVDNAIGNGVVGEDDLFPYKDGDAIVEIGWVELNIQFPFKEGSQAKMLSAQGATFSVVNGNQSSVTEEFVNDFTENKSDDLLKQAKQEFEISKRHLNAFTRAEQYETLSPDAGEYFDELREAYPEEVEKIEKQFDGFFKTILNQAGSKKTTSEEGKSTEGSTEEETKADVEEEDTTVKEETEEDVDLNQDSKDTLESLLGDDFDL